MELYHQETGNPQGESILFIHGAGISGYFWKKQLAAFSKDFHCITVDLPDHGKSAEIPFTTIPEIAAELLELIKKIGHNGKAIVVGHSLGAKIAAFMVAKSTPQVTKAVIASALFHKSLLFELAANRTLIKFSLDLFAKYPGMIKYQARAYQFHDEEMENAWISETKAIQLASMERYMRAFGSEMELPDHLPEVSIPVLILTGDQEPGSMKKSGMKLQNAIPTSRYFLLKKSNHVYPANNAPLFNSILKQFFTDTIQADERLKIVKRRALK